MIFLAALQSSDFDEISLISSGTVAFSLDFGFPGLVILFCFQNVFYWMMIFLIFKIAANAFNMEPSASTIRSCA